MSTKKTTIGGQALIEGIMMRGPEKSSMAVLKPDGEIFLETWETYPNGAPSKIKKMPFFRGIFSMVETMGLGYKCLMRSADIAETEESEPGKFELWIAKTFKINLESVVTSLAMIVGVGLALGLMIILPTYLASFFKEMLASSALIALVEGFFKIVLFVGYLFFTSLNKDIRRVYGFHGAEHKTIACYEAGEELTPENCQKHGRLHPRCGTSFILIVLIVYTIIFSIVPPLNTLLRIAIRLAVLPIVVGISYEFIKLAGRHDNIVTRILSAPGLWLQKITTKEPDTQQLEVAIAAMNAVIPEDKENDNW